MSTSATPASTLGPMSSSGARSGVPTAKAASAPVELDEGEQRAVGGRRASGHGPERSGPADPTRRAEVLVRILWSGHTPPMRPEPADTPADDEPVIDLRALEQGPDGEGWRVLRVLNEQYDRDPSTMPTVDQLAAALRSLADSDA